MSDNLGNLLSQDLLEELRRRWVDSRAPIASRLRPGLSEQQMDELTAPLGLKLNGEARTWWGWHDGAEPGERALDRTLVGTGWKFLSLAEAVGFTQQLRGIAEHAAGSQRDLVWGWTWLVVGTEAGGGALSLDCGVRGAASPVTIRWPDEGTREATHLPTMGQAVQWWIEGMDAGYLAFDPEKGLWTYDYLSVPPERLATRVV